MMKTECSFLFQLLGSFVQAEDRRTLSMNVLLLINVSVDNQSVGNRIKFSRLVYCLLPALCQSVSCSSLNKFIEDVLLKSLFFYD